MKLASLNDGSRDGCLILVSQDLSEAVAAADIAATLQGALDDWKQVAPALAARSDALNAGKAEYRFPFAAHRCLAPLPRAFQWVDASAYVNHMELVRKARGAEMPPSFWEDPLIYQGGSDHLLAAHAPIAIRSEAWGTDLEAEIAVITDDVPMGSTPEAAGQHIRLLMLINDISLRHLIPGELAKGFGFYQSKPASACSPVAVTPDELGAAWDGRRLHLPLVSSVNGRRLGAPEAGSDMTFDYPTLLAHAARTRRLGAGTILGGGTVSNVDRSHGSACLAEVRMLETLAHGEAKTEFLKAGDRVRIEMFDPAGQSIFGAIDQVVERVEPAED
ncbi:MAG: fumarylacetoacetate hydrolase family protein [Gammaproteobacteria bacterium]|nr:fumarylacetoacetate hydrolase family protein [Gammaproteobacteria bacterium]